MNLSRSLPVLALAATFATAGCTRWGVKEVAGPRRELDRRPLGSPQITETTSTEIAGAFAASSDDGSAAGAVAGGAVTVKRKHCLQKAEIDYIQSIDRAPVVINRKLDLIGAAVLALVGLSAIASTYDSQGRMGPLDPEPIDPAVGYGLGAGIMAAGAAWLGVSFAVLPGSAPPNPEPTERRWTEIKFVDSDGCPSLP